jgi:hypothetical protein
MSAGETVKAEMQIFKTSEVGKFVNVESYEDFCAIIKVQENVADFFAEAEKIIAQKLQVGIDAKSIIDSRAREIKKNSENLRTWITKYMESEGIEKFEGKEIKSITFQSAKEQRGEIAVKQIKIGAKFVKLDDISRESLIEMLEEKGVKFRTVTEKVVKKTTSSVRVQK